MSEATEKKRKHLPLGVELLALLLAALLVSFLLKALFVQAFYIPSGSMKPLLVENDRILVQKPSYWFGEPQRGDVVVFKDPGGWLDDDGSGPSGFARVLETVGLYPSGGHLVKRVIGVGGDHVVCCDDDGRLVVNEVPLDESEYLAPGVRPSEITFDKTIPEGFLWLMGDNRQNSADSRAHLGAPGGGVVPVGNVVGKAVAVVWPLDHFQVIRKPEVFK